MDPRANELEMGQDDWSKMDKDIEGASHRRCLSGGNHGWTTMDTDGA